MRPPRSSDVFPVQKQTKNLAELLCIQTRNLNASCFAQSYNALGDDPVTRLRMGVPVRLRCRAVSILMVKICLVITLAGASPKGTPWVLPTIPQLRV